MAFSAETRELAFKVWYGCGMNECETARLMESEHDYVITRQTLAEWRDKYGWPRRAARMDVMKQTAADNVLTFEEELLQSLMEQKKRYDRYFETLEEGKVDTQAMYAYTQLCKQLKELHREVKPKEKKHSRKGLAPETVEEIKNKVLGL